MTRKFNVCPPWAIDQLRNSYSRVVDVIGDDLDVPRVLIGFVVEAGYFQFLGEFTSDPGLHVKLAKSDEGLMGDAIDYDTLVEWPGSPSGYIETDKRTRLELAVPIRYKGSPCGSLLVNFREEELPTKPQLTILRQKLEDWATRLSSILDQEEDQDTLKALKVLVLDCKTKTQSIRGFFALRRVNGEVKYIYPDSSSDVFMHLDEASGLVGRVFRTGQTLNAENVWVEDDYIPSDQRVDSELIIPYTVQGETVAVINMEAYNRSHFGKERENTTAEYLERAKPLIDKLLEEDRKRVRNADPMSQHLPFFLGQKNPSDARDLDHLRSELDGRLEEEISKAFPGCFVIHWNKGFEPPAELSQLKWVDSAEPVVIENGENFVSVSPVRFDGRLVKQIGVVWSDRPSTADHNLLVYLCRFAERSRFRQEKRWSSNCYEELIQDITKPDTRPDALRRIILKVKQLIDVDHCTIFLVGNVGFSQAERDTREVLLPFASTAFELETADGVPPYYEIDERDGLTGFVGARKMTVVLQNIEDRAELLEYSKVIRWSKKLSEDESDDVRSFIASPLIDRASNELLGVVRAYRKKGKGRPPFSQTEIRRFKTICDAMQAVQVWRTDTDQQGNT